jgi:hypothetical protein
MHVPAACAIDGAGYAEYFALGDYELPSAPAKGHFLRDVGADLPEVDPAARELLVVADENGRTWTGRGAVGSTGDIDVLLLPSLASCALTGSVGVRAGTTLASIGGVAGGRVLVVGGSGTPTPQTYVARLDTGQVDPVSPELRTPRTRGASVTAFGDGALVAGGVGEDNAALDTAEVFDTLTGGFNQREPPIILSEARSEHGATTLASGETLLVGGVGADGTTLLSSMEIVDPASRTVRAEGVARLAVARRNPTVLRLASGEILVAGGSDAAGLVTRLEWFLPNVSAPTRCSAELVAGSARSFIALQAGGALAVVAPPPGAPAGFPNAWVIGADCVVEPAAPIAGTLTQPVLFGGAGGAPILWTGDRWLQWSPWSGAFVALAVLDDVPAHVGDASTSADPGLAVWLDAGTSTVTALRFDARGAYSTLPSSILVTDATETAPDRLVAAGVVSFDASLGALVLAPGASAFVTDRTYADVAIDVTAPTGEPAVIVLRDELGAELEVGGVSCLGTDAGGAASTHVERRGGVVSWSLAGGASGTCGSGVAPSARLSVGFRGAMSSTRSVVRDVLIRRLGAP